MRHHVILGEALSLEALLRGGHRNSLLGPSHWLVFYNHSGQVCGDKETPPRPPVLEGPLSLEFLHLETPISAPGTDPLGGPHLWR